MGFNSTASTISLTAKLTAFGRQQLLGKSSSIITHFSVSDSDANYNAALPLETGEVISSAGNLGLNNNTSNSVAIGYSPRSLVYYNSLGQTAKLVKEGSSNIINSTSLLGQKTVSATTLTQNVIDKNDYETDSLVNLFYSFRLPINAADEALFTATTASRGGYADTALSGIATDKIFVIGIDNSQYGELLDGKTLKVEVTDTGATTYTLYGTYEKTLTTTKKQDANFKETSFNSAIFGSNIVFLFSDTIQKPNADATKSWATGHFATKPYSVSNKSLFNMKNDTITSTVADEVVGVAFLDKGFIVVTHPTIVNAMSVSGDTGTTVAFDSVSTQVVQEVTCLLDRGEFATSNNTTYSKGDTVRISEVLLLDSSKNIIAVAKTDRHILKTAQQFMALGIKITV